MKMNNKNGKFRMVVKPAFQTYFYTAASMWALNGVVFLVRGRITRLNILLASVVVPCLLTGLVLVALFWVYFAQRSSIDRRQ